MGIFDRVRALGTRPQRSSSELPQEALDAAMKCVVSGRDAGTMTRGRGSAHLLQVAGTQYRKEAISSIARRYRRERRDDPIAAAVVVRDPTNSHDSNAVRVLIDGIHVGFLSRDNAIAWQPTLVECERRGLTLVGMVRFVGKDGWGLRLQLRDNLPGFDGLATAAGKARAAKLAGDGVPSLLDAVRLGVVADALTVNENRPPTSKRAAGLMAKRIRKALDEIYAHAAAVKQGGRKADADGLLDLVDDVESLLDDLIRADDGEERKDLTFELSMATESLNDAVRMSFQLE